MPRPRRRRAAAEPTPFDRQAADLPHGAVTAVDVIEDPYSPAGQVDRIKVLRSIRNDPLGQLMSRGQIDRAQYESGRRWERHYDLAGLSGVRAIDFAKTPVDGHSQTGTGLSDKQILAASELRRAAAHLGVEGARLAQAILGDGLTRAAYAERRGLRPSEDVVRYFGRQFRECLESLAQFWGYVG